MLKLVKYSQSYGPNEVYDKDNEVIKAVEEMKQAEVKILRDEEWWKVDSVIYKERKIYIPKNDKLRVEIIRLYHNTLVGEHRRQ